MNKLIYLDYAATTPVDEQVMQVMQTCMVKEGVFGNPASQTHEYGFAAEQLVFQARKQVAELINATPEEIIWTSGATEANNLAIQGIAKTYGYKKKHIITIVTEHKAVLDTCKELSRQGFNVTVLPVKNNGLLDLNLLKQAITPDTLLASIMYVNNETGVIQDIHGIGQVLKQHNVFFHVDAVQALGKLVIDAHKLPVDLMSFSAHKMYGPKGIGVLYQAKLAKVRLKPLMYGGGQEQGLRPGTLPTHQIAGFGRAAQLAQENMDLDNSRIRKLRNLLWSNLNKELSDIYWNGSDKSCVANHLNISIGGVEGEALLMALDGVAVSSGSACNSATITLSHVLIAMGISSTLAHSSLRFSLGRYTTENEINIASKIVIDAVLRLRSISPCWQEPGILQKN